ncbi:MAG: hypothetical protein EXR48_04665 [Dehalococcoidia bacterium]|nr:hypothetical protein [Dehalococcoidia bacterium]
MQPPTVLARITPALQGHFHTLLQSRSEPLYRMAEYQLGWVDEHGTPEHSPPLLHHAAACLLASEALGARPAQALPAATALELAYQFVCVHTEVQDGTPTAHKRPTVWWVWGPAQAINAGDSLHALARLSLAGLADAGVPAATVLDCLARLDAACLELCEAQYTDLAAEERVDVTLEAYTKVVEGKRGALLGCALELGALVAGATTAQVESFRRAGRRLGLALQAHAEIAALWNGDHEAPQDDLLNKWKGLPYVLALRLAQPKQQRELAAVYRKRVLEPPDVARLAATFEDVGARASAQDMVEQWEAEAVRELDATGLPAHQLAPLKELASYLLALD